MNRAARIEPTTYQWRTTDCEHCWEGKVERTVESGFNGAGGYYSVDCDECGGNGEVEASCAGCGDERPLNDDGLCADCDVALTEVRSDPFLGLLP